MLHKFTNTMREPCTVVDATLIRTNLHIFIPTYPSCFIRNRCMKTFNFHVQFWHVYLGPTLSLRFAEYTYFWFVLFAFLRNVFFEGPLVHLFDFCSLTRYTNKGISAIWTIGARAYDLWWIMSIKIQEGPIPEPFMFMKELYHHTCKYYALKCLS